MTELISEEDIQSLLSSLKQDSDSDLLLSDGDASTSGTQESLALSKNYKIKIYDFKSPDRFSKDQIRTLQMIYENYCRTVSTTLSTYLRKFTSMHVSSIDQISYEQFTKTVNTPSTLAVIDMNPLQGSAVLEIPPVITFSFIDRLFGGEGSVIKDFRELTDIEFSVLESVVSRLLSNLREVWANIVDLRPKIERLEGNVHFLQILPPNDTVALINLETKVGDVEGTILFCLPYIILESIMNNLSARSIYANYSQTQGESYQEVKQHTMKLPIDISVEVKNIKLTINEILNLKKGDYIHLDKKVTDEFVMKVENEAKYKVVPGTKDKKMAVKIVNYVKEEKEEEKETLFSD